MKIALIVVLVLIAFVGVMTMRQPDTFRVERTTTVKAPPAKVFALVNDFHNWAAWSPWEKLDPAMKKEYGGAPAGVGATYAWEGNSKAGQGNMKITESVPDKLVKLDLNFIKPFEGNNITEVTITPTAEGSTVQWAMYGPMPLMSKVMSVFTSLDKMIGPDFEEGLGNIKTIAEKP